MLNICSNRAFYTGVIYTVYHSLEGGQSLNHLRNELLEIKCVESRCFCFFAFVNFVILIKSKVWDFSNSTFGDVEGENTACYAELPRRNSSSRIVI